jgi:putative membrane protein
MKKLMLAALLALPLVAAADESALDQSFYKKAVEGGLAEIQLGQLAQQKGQSQAVKDYGEMMVQDHTATGDKLKTLASGNGLALPTSPDMTQMATQSNLEALSGRAFDKAYIRTMIQDHKDTIALFEKEAKNGDDTSAKAFAQTTLLKLYEHLRKIQQIAKAT